jgi:hypothetical protein
MENKKWNGVERRKPRDDGKEGRRVQDIHCYEHAMLWEHHDQDKANNRALVCGKISDIKANIILEVKRLEENDSKIENKIDEIKSNMIGKYWGRVVVAFMCASILALGVQQNWAFKEILVNQRDFAVTINNIENKQVKVMEKIIVFEKEMDRLNKRQDILRDTSIKHMTEEHKKP